MTFKGLRFAGLEWKNITASKVMWVVIAAIAIMPLLYGALYLAAFQDPYARLNTVPVAVVNEDAGAVIAGESRTLGNDVVDELKKTDDGLQWNFVSADEAERGLEDGTYFMVCTIPSDFSESVASVDGDAPRKAQLKIQYNQSENMLASQIGETVWKEVRQRVSDTVANEYWTTVLGRVADSGKDIQTAADGAGTLESGLVTARDGSRTITTNLGTLKEGALSLDGGLGVLSAGLYSLDDGLVTLQSGATALEGGTGSLVAGARELKGGTGRLVAGSTEVAGGASSLEGGAGSLRAGIVSLSESVGSSTDSHTAGNQTLFGGANDLALGVAGLPDQMTAVANGAQAIDAAVNKGSAATGGASLTSLQATEQQLVDQQGALVSSLQQKLANGGSIDADDLSQLASLQAGITAANAGRGAILAQLSPGATALADKTADAPASAQQLKGGADALQQGIAVLSASIGSPTDSYSNGQHTLFGGANDVLGGSQRLAAGAAQVADGASQVNDGAVSAVSGAQRLDAGASQLAAGAASARDGASQLSVGAGSAREGSSQIASGAAQLAEGSAVLTDGLADAVDGSGELSEKLAEGARTAADQTTDIAGKADTMADPVELVNSYYTTVKNYGTGFAPYFMALGLWVGGLVAGFVFKPLNSRLILSGGNPVMVAFANFIPMAVFAVIQATLLMVVLQFGLQLQIDNVPAFYAMGYLTAIVFAAIMQFLMAAFGFPGKFLAIILLMLQLTACAGTFPIQTTPPFFQAINPFMPMTYVVSGMRQIMTGFDYSVVALDCFVLFAIGAACFALTSVVAYRKRTVRMEDLHPVLQLG